MRPAPVPSKNTEFGKQQEMDALYVQLCRCEKSLPDNVQLKCQFDIYIDAERRDGKCMECSTPEDSPEVVDDDRINKIPVAELQKMWSRCVRNVEQFPVNLASSVPFLANSAPLMSTTLGALGRASNMYTEEESTLGNPFGAVLNDLTRKLMHDNSHKRTASAGKNVTIKGLDGEMKFVHVFVSLGTVVEGSVGAQDRITIVSA